MQCRRDRPEMAHDHHDRLRRADDGARGRPLRRRVRPQADQARRVPRGGARSLAGVRRQRRWPRKRVIGGFRVTANGRPAAVVDVGYGGLRLEMPDGEHLPDTFDVEVAGIGLHLGSSRSGRCPRRTRARSSAAPRWRPGHARRAHVARNRRSPQRLIDACALADVAGLPGISADSRLFTMSSTRSSGAVAWRAASQSITPRPAAATVRARRSDRRATPGGDDVRAATRRGRLVELYLRASNAIDRRVRRCVGRSSSIPRRSRSPTRSTPSARRRAPRGPLHGIPVLIKDNIDTADRMMTTAGSLALEGSIAPQRRVRRRAAARRRRGDPRQDEPERVGELPLDAVDERLERARRAGAAIRTRSIAIRAGRAPAPAPRLRRTSRRSASAPRPTARSSARPARTALVGIKPTVGLVSRIGHHPDLAHAGHGRTDGAHGRRRRDAARRAGRRRSARSPRRRRGRARGATTRRRSTPDALKGARIGVARKRYFGYSPATDRADRRRRSPT